MLPWLLLDTKNGPKQHKKVFFARRAKKAAAEDRSPPQELEVGPRSGPYLLVYINNLTDHSPSVSEQTVLGQ